MSASLPEAAVNIDWKLVASAGAVFVGTVVTTVWGWVQGRKKSEKSAAAPTDSPLQIAGAVLQDNASLRENTQAVKDLRDQMMFLRDAVERRIRSEDELQESIDELCKRLDKVAY